MIKIKSTALLFAIIILSTGSVFAQTSNSKPEDFKSFSKKFFKDKKFQLERIVFPVTLYKCERTTTEQGKNTHSDTFDQFSKMNKKLSSYLEMDNVDEDAEYGEFNLTFAKCVIVPLTLPS